MTTYIQLSLNYSLITKILPWIQAYCPVKTIELAVQKLSDAIPNAFSLLDVCLRALMSRDER